MKPNPRNRRSRCGVLQLVLLLPTLLFGARLEGQALFVHAHGEEGTHVHVVAESATRAHAHGHGHADGHLARAPEPQAQPQPADAPHSPTGEPRDEPRDETRFSFPSPGPLFKASIGSLPLARLATLYVGHVPEPRVHAGVAAPLAGTGPPGRDRPRSGTVAVLATSRALLL